ncbi:MAG: hypothetical protein ACKO8Z_15680 [Prosthecobacter sp.]
MVNLPIEYSEKPVTPFGGMALMKRFVDQTGIREHLATLDLPRGGSNCAYEPVHVIESFWLGIWTRASRYIPCDWLRQDEKLAAIFGYVTSCPAKAPTAGSSDASPKRATRRCSRHCNAGSLSRSTSAR